MSVYFHGMSYKEYLLDSVDIKGTFGQFMTQIQETAANVVSLALNICILLTAPVWFFPLSWIVFSRCRHFAQGHNLVFMPRRSEKNCDDCGINYLCSKSGLSKHGACKGGKAGYWAVEHEEE